MNVESVKILLDSCFVGKHITQTMKELPDGFKPRHIHVIECIFKLSKELENVRVNDVSDTLHITTPSVTKLINELQQKGALEKFSLADDKRVTVVVLTDLGREYQEKYVANYHTALAQGLSDITDEQVEMTAKIIARLQTEVLKNGE